jgi:CheY-like chemotaxis protein
MTDRSPDSSAAAASPVRLLVVDDNPDIHDLFRKMLLPARSDDAALDQMEAELFPGEARASTSIMPLDVTIDSAFQGEQAVTMVEAARDNPYVLAFVDVRMPPGMDGIQTIKKLWQHAPDLYVVVCTAYSDHSWESITQFLGSSPNLLILRKPFETIEVRQIVSCITTMYAVLSRMKASFDGLAALAEGAARDDLAHRARASARAELTGTATLSVGPEGVVVDADGGVERLLGLGRDEVIGRPLGELLEGCDDLSAASPAPKRRARTRNGSRREVEVAGAPVEVPDGQTEMLLVVSPA